MVKHLKFQWVVQQEWQLCDESFHKQSLSLVPGHQQPKCLAEQSRTLAESIHPSLSQGQTAVAHPQDYTQTYTLVTTTCCHLANDTDLLMPVLWAMAGDKQIDLWPADQQGNQIVTPRLPWKFHANWSSHFPVMLLTKKQRKKETNRPKTITRPLPGAG